MMTPVRILHIVHTMNRGGMESRIMDLYRGLNKEKYQYDFYIESGRKGDYDEEIISIGGRVFYNSNHDKLNIPDFREFGSFLKDHSDYKIVYAYNQWAGWYLKVAKKFGISVRIASSRTSLDSASAKNIIKNIVKSNVNKYSTHCFAVSKKAGMWLFGKKTVELGKVRIFPNAIDTQKYEFSETVRDRVRKELKLEDSFIVMHVGNIRYAKNHPFLLKVFSEVKKSHTDAKLVLIGGGDFDSLSEDVDELDIRDSVLHLGVRSDIPELLQAGDVFVFPSFYEGFPGAVLEAEASGLNCVISDSITDEVMLSDNIFSLPLDAGPEKWACAIDEFGRIDRSLSWKKIKDAGYDLYGLVNTTEELYEKMIKEM